MNIARPFILKTFMVTVMLVLAVSVLYSQSKIHYSDRSRRVTKKITPALEKEFGAQDIDLGSKVFIRIFKEEHILELWVQKGEEYVLFKEYPVAYYSGGLGTKTKYGDQKSPEGFYTVYPHSLNPYSSYHLSFNIGYPNAYERYRGYTGNYIMIHGNEVSIGCYAMTDPVIEEIYVIVQQSFEKGEKSFPVHIFPFKMTAENLEKHKKNVNMPFWKELYEGFCAFEEQHIPPDIKVVKGRYTIA